MHYFRMRPSSSRLKFDDDVIGTKKIRPHQPHHQLHDLYQAYWMPAVPSASYFLQCLIIVKQNLLLVDQALTVCRDTLLWLNLSLDATDCVSILHIELEPWKRSASNHSGNREPPNVSVTRTRTSQARLRARARGRAGACPRAFHGCILKVLSQNLALMDHIIELKVANIWLVVQISAWSAIQPACPKIQSSKLRLKNIKNAKNRPKLNVDCFGKEENPITIKKRRLQPKSNENF